MTSLLFLSLPSYRVQMLLVVIQEREKREEGRGETRYDKVRLSSDRVWVITVDWERREEIWDGQVYTGSENKKRKGKNVNGVREWEWLDVTDKWLIIALFLFRLSERKRSNTAYAHEKTINNKKHRELIMHGTISGMEIIPHWNLIMYHDSCFIRITSANNVLHFDLRYNSISQ